MPPGEKTYAFAFPFENTGDSTAEIREIKTTCGCTTATLEKKTYAPGESGVILGTFSPEGRVGDQSKAIFVSSFLNSEEQDIKLILKLHVPELLKMEPHLLIWRSGKELDGKSIKISLNKDYGAALKSVECDTKKIMLNTEQIPGHEGQYILNVLPDSTFRGRALIKVNAAVPDADEKEFFAYVVSR